MVRIVDGKIVSDTEESGSSDDGTLLTLFGYKLGKLQVGVILLLAYFLGGFGVFVVSGFGLGVAYVLTNSSGSSTSSSSSSAPASSNIRTIGDYPKPAKC